MSVLDAMLFPDTMLSLRTMLFPDAMISLHTMPVQMSIVKAAVLLSLMNTVENTQYTFSLESKAVSLAAC